MAPQKASISKFNLAVIIFIILAIFAGFVYVLLSPSDADNFRKNTASGGFGYQAAAQQNHEQSFVATGGVEADRPKPWEQHDNKAKSISDYFETVEIKEACWDTMPECLNNFYGTLDLVDVRKFSFQRTETADADHFKITCANGSVDKPIQYNTSYTLPAHWSGCKLFIYGRQNRQVKLRLFY